jgi:hypothetical protein
LGVAESVMTVPWPNIALQVAPQEMPAGDDAIVPLPPFETVRVYWLSVKVAVTVAAAVTVVVQVSAVPEQPPPDQPPKVEPVVGAAVNVTIVL